jgi:hypothetical protein
MSDLQNPASTVENPVQNALGASSRLGRTRLLLGVAITALVAGASGAGITLAAFQPHVGPTGPAGPAGPAGTVGPEGPAGQRGSSQVIDTNKLGYCFESSYQYNNDINWIDSVYLSAPTSNGGTLSCTSGSFVPLTPVGPNGQPVKNYEASKTP